MCIEIISYNNKQAAGDKEICEKLCSVINSQLPDAESKVWHAHPVWFLDQNPIVGYSKQKAGIRLLFWSGADFEEDLLNLKGKKFKDASIFYTNISDIDSLALTRWLKKSREIQWNYKNIVKRKGKLEKLS